MTYEEKAADLGASASIAVMILASEDCSDVDLMPLKPRMMPPNECEFRRQAWRGRDLKTLGIAGLVGAVPRFELKEPLDLARVSRLADAFLDHIHGILCDGLEAS
jgi:hypothetical protein